MILNLAHMRRVMPITLYPRCACDPSQRKGTTSGNRGMKWSIQRRRGVGGDGGDGGDRGGRREG